LFLLASAIMLYLVGQAEHFRGRAERAQMETNRQLNATIDNLREAQQQLIESEKLAALGSLVKGVAHEINTPLGVGVTAATHMQEEVRALARNMQNDKLTRSGLRQFVDNAQMANQMLVANLDRAAKLVHSFKQVASDQSEQVRSQFTLSECLDSISVSMRPKLTQSHHRIELNCPTNIRMDSFPGAVSQSLTHLISNALEHGLDPAQPGTVSIDCHRNGKRVRITCSDNGGGIAPDILARIFDPFVTTGRGQGRVGLGLHIAYNLITATLGGRINCESSATTGTRFYIDLPLNTPEIHSRDIQSGSQSRSSESG